MGSRRAVVDLPAGVRSPAAARHVVAELADAWGLPELAGDAQLITSELVSNAVQHAADRGSLELELVEQGDGLRIAVVDGSSVRPRVRELRTDAQSGRGMAIVVALAADWGSDEHHGGKRVWADLNRPNGIRR